MTQWPNAKNTVFSLKMRFFTKFVSVGGFREHKIDRYLQSLINYHPSNHIRERVNSRVQHNSDDWKWMNHSQLMRCIWMSPEGSDTRTRTLQRWVPRATCRLINNNCPLITAPTTNSVAHTILSLFAKAPFWARQNANTHRNKTKRKIELTYQEIAAIRVSAPLVFLHLHFWCDLHPACRRLLLERRFVFSSPKINTRVPF